MRLLVLWLLCSQLGGLHHTHHYEQLHSQAPGYNSVVLQAVDAVQASAPDGGGYFIGLKADPPESPIGYVLKLFGHPLLQPPRPTSYCSGSSYTVFIETLNRLYPGMDLSPERLEALRMQEPDGSRREDRVKAWGWWNADGFGTQYAMVQYLGMGQTVTPDEARPGDFVNLSWKSGLGHSVVFLGYRQDDEGHPGLAYFSSQPKSNGLADQLARPEAIQELKFVRLTHPEGVFSFDPQASVDPHVSGDRLPEDFHIPLTTR